MDSSRRWTPSRRTSLFLALATLFERRHRQRTLRWEGLPGLNPRRPRNNQFFINLKYRLKLKIPIPFNTYRHLAIPNDNWQYLTVPNDTNQT
jgi:hypothetical protein